MLRALDETVIAGVPTTGPFHKLLLNHHAFKAGNVDTGFIPKYIDELKTPPPTSKVREDEATAAAAAAAAAAAVRAWRGLIGEGEREDGRRVGWHCWEGEIGC
jgi:acetyl/propionyl-CoA carboxylase alpha subunit